MQGPSGREGTPDLVWSLIAALALASLVFGAELAWWRSRPRPTRRATPAPEPSLNGTSADLRDPGAGVESVDRELEETMGRR